MYFNWDTQNGYQVPDQMVFDTHLKGAQPIGHRFESYIYLVGEAGPSILSLVLEKYKAYIFYQALKLYRSYSMHNWQLAIELEMSCIGNLGPHYFAD